MLLMLIGECFNFAAYAFAPAVIITPLGALSVVVSAFLSSIFLKERLNFAGKIGCFQCIVGAIIIVLHTPSTEYVTTTIPGFVDLVVKPAFLTFACLLIAIVIFLIVYVGPRWGQKLPIVFITICSIIGALVVIATQGLGAALVYTATNPNDSQLVYWQTYFTIGFIISGGVVQINYLNKALNIFSTAVVSPVYYVIFTTFTLISAGILTGGTFNFQNAVNFTTLCFGFLTIVGGVALLFEYSLKLSRIEALAATRQGSENIGTHVGMEGRTSHDDVSAGDASSKLSLPLIERQSFANETLDEKRV